MTTLETLVYTGTHDIGANVTIGPCPTYFVCKSGLDWTNTTIHFLYFLLLLLLLPRVPALFSTTLSHDAFVNLGDLKGTFHLLGGPRVVMSKEEKIGVIFSNFWVKSCMWGVSRIIWVGLLFDFGRQNWAGFGLAICIGQKCKWDFILPFLF